jgi:integrase
MNLAFSTVRQLRSAVSQFLTWDMMVATPGAFMDQQRRVLQLPCRATDGLGYTLYSAGMRARVGDETHPSVALLDCHVRELDQELNRSYLASTSNLERRELALAGLANLFLWLGWLRSSECWDLTWEDLMVIEPADSATVDLPTGCGMVSGRLAPKTKSAWSHRPDVPMAYKLLSGFHLGKWFHRARANVS